MIAYLLDRYRAWRRNEVRTAPKGVRGRVYARKDDDAGGMAARTAARATMHIRVLRADGTVEDHGSVPMREV